MLTRAHFTSPLTDRAVLRIAGISLRVPESFLL
jgi:hypothetical protein